MTVVATTSEAKHWFRTLGAVLGSLAPVLVIAFPAHLGARANAPLQYFYADLGRLTKVVDQNGNKATYSYDVVGGRQLTYCILAGATISAAAGGQATKQQTYFNRNYKFCVRVPANWSQGEPFTRNGAVLSPNDTKAFSAPPRITVGAYPDQPSETEDRPQTLDENIQSVVNSLKQYGSAVDIRILKNDKETLQNLDAQTISLQYRESNTGQEWFTKDVNLIDGHRIVYFVELKCHPKDAGALESIFDDVVKSLRLECNGKTRTSKFTR